VSAQTERWVWIEANLIHAVHDEQLAEHGGGSRVRDDKLLQSALAKPRQLANYGSPDVADLAASYGYGISRNHPFIDGNKRTGFVALELFLGLNGFDLLAEDADCVLTMLGVAAGDTSEADLAQWIKRHMQSRQR